MVLQGGEAGCGAGPAINHLCNHPVMAASTHKVGQGTGVGVWSPEVPKAPRTKADDRALHSFIHNTSIYGCFRSAYVCYLLVFKVSLRGGYPVTPLY